jgi:CRISPR-associated exonuclease Cas4
MDEVEDDRIPISALQHVLFCRRQCALIHVEQVWDDNLFTFRGNRLHERVDDPGASWEGEERLERALPIWSKRLGLTGKADLVVFKPNGAPYPVEFKSGRRKERLADQVQLCAQGICLEEMFGTPVPAGALFYHASRRRKEIVFTDGLRHHVEDAITRVRVLLASSILPPPVADARCKDCSLIDACLPFALGVLGKGKG